jgi:RND family efflux transporter MFP subunit
MRSRGALFAVALLALLAGCKRQNAYVAPPPAEVGVAQPLRQPFTPYLETTGNTAAYNQVDLVARVSGFLQEIRYKDGALAHRGDTLFVIEPDPYKAKLQQAQASLTGAQALLVQSDAEYKRQSSLGKTDFASQSAVDQALAKRDSDRANVTNEQAGVVLAATNVAYTQVNAPFDGLVSEHLASVGELVGQSGPTKLATIVQLDPIYVNFNVSEQDVLRIRERVRALGIKPGEAAINAIAVEVGLMTEKGFPHRGTLDYIAPTLDAQTGTLSVRAVFSNPNRELLPGFFVRVRVPLPQAVPDALLVPEMAIGTDQSGRYVLVVDKDDVVQQRNVTPGQALDTLRVISAGLQPDDRVVISGLERAIPGAKVAPQPAAITPPVAPDKT